MSLNLLTRHEVKEKRKALKMNQTELSAMIGCHFKSLSMFELGLLKSLRIRYLATRILLALESGESIDSAALRAEYVKEDQDENHN